MLGFVTVGEVISAARLFAVSLGLFTDGLNGVYSELCEYRLDMVDPRRDAPGNSRLLSSAVDAPWLIAVVKKLWKAGVFFVCF